MNQQISELVFVKPNIPTLKYGRDIEIEAANTFTEFIMGKHKDIKLSVCGLFVDETLPYVVQAQTEFCCVHVVKRIVWKSNAPIQ